MPSLINNEAEDSSSESSSDESSGSDESSDSDDEPASSRGDETGINPAKPAFGNILDMDAANVPIQYNKQTSTSSSVAAGLEDLVMAPLVSSKDDINKPSNIDEESGVWRDHVRPDLSGGLLVKMRFVYGRSREKEARLLGLDPSNPSTVCLQVHIENM